jgi:hypothetical protein
MHSKIEAVSCEFVAAKSCSDLESVLHEKANTQAILRIGDGPPA